MLLAAPLDQDQKGQHLFVSCAMLYLRTKEYGIRQGFQEETAD